VSCNYNPQYDLDLEVLQKQVAVQGFDLLKLGVYLLLETPTNLPNLPTERWYLPNEREVLSGNHKNQI
jgi:hypothetical protein